MALIYAAHGYEVMLPCGSVLAGNKDAEEAFKREVFNEAREDQKAVARRVLANSTDISCDNIAAAFGLSAHTVRGMNRDKRRNRRGKQELTEFTREEILATQVEW
jgi:hypothetical protein